MSVNASGASLPHGMHCLVGGRVSLVFLVFFIINVLLLLPTCILVLVLGLRQRRSASAAPCSHSDMLTYHVAVMELVGVAGCVLCCVTIYAGNLSVLWVGFSLWCFALFGETIIHVLTCVERYLAVVRPVTYLGMRGERGVRIRDLSIGCAWLLAVAGICTMNVGQMYIYSGFTLVVFSLIITSFSSFSVLRILKRPGPGGHGEPGERVDQIKQRAFFTITAILGILSVRFFWNLVWVVTNLRGEYVCLAVISGIWFNMPCSVVLPLLFLHRAGRPACCKNGRTKMRLNHVQ